MRFEKWRQPEDETIDNFLDNMEMLRRRSQPDESSRRMNLAVASKFIDGVKNGDEGDRTKCEARTREWKKNRWKN